jgi:hypothetical protein
LHSRYFCSGETTIHFVCNRLDGPNHGIFSFTGFAFTAARYAFGSGGIRGAPVLSRHITLYHTCTPIHHTSLQREQALLLLFAAASRLMMVSILANAVFIFIGLLSAKSYVQGFELVLVPTSSTNYGTNLTALDSRYLPRKGFLAVTNEPWSIVLPKNRSASDHLQPTSKQAEQHDCFLATNGGPYHRDGTCVGAVIVDGNIGEDRFDGVGFGVTRQPNRTWVIGRVESSEQARALRLQHYVTGFDWLVYNGAAVAMERNNTTGADKAPRTAVGIDSEGRLMLLVADGCEKW